MDTSASKPELESQVVSKHRSGKAVPEFEVRNEFWSYGEYELVGHGKQTNAKCGVFSHFLGCLNKEAHNASRWFYPDLPKDSVFSKPVYHSCDKPTCPVCYKYGWAVRQAVRMERRLKEASRRLGLPVEHIVVSVPKRLYGLSLEDMRAKARKALAVRGIVGGSMIVHLFRYRNRVVSTRTGLPVSWYFSPHFHVLGFVGGSGYAQCRGCADCPNGCRGCVGFNGVSRREFEKDGFIVKVMGERKTIGGTCWYQLSHCSIRRGSKKSHAVSWFGVVSYRKMKMENLKDIVNHKCPLCGSDLVRVRYLGVFRDLHLNRRGQVTPFYGADGKPLWEIVVDRKFDDG